MLGKKIFTIMVEDDIYYDYVTESCIGTGLLSILNEQEGPQEGAVMTAYIKSYSNDLKIFYKKYVISTLKIRISYRNYIKRDPKRGKHIVRIYLSNAPNGIAS